MRAGSLLLTVALAAGLLSACTTTSQHALSKTDISEMRLADVKVTFAPDAKVTWPEVDELQRKEVATPNARLAKIDHLTYGSYAEHRLAAALHTEAKEMLADTFTGTRPVRLEITIRALLIPSSADRTAHVIASTAVSTLIGGVIAGSVVASNVQGMWITGDAAVVDVASNQVLAQTAELKGSSNAAQLTGESVDSLAIALLRRVKQWITGNAFAR